MKAKRPRETKRGGLTVEQVRDLTKRLEAGGLNLGEVGDAVWALRHEFPLTQARLSGATEIDRVRRDRHFSDLLEHAIELRECLAVERPLIATSGVEWGSFDETLARIIASARAESEAARPNTARGRRPEEWRDQLIALVRSVYPDRVFTKRGGRAHFEGTIEMLLGFLNVELGDVRRTVRDVLKRAPAPPFKIVK